MRLRRLPSSELLTSYHGPFCLDTSGQHNIEFKKERGEEMATLHDDMTTLQQNAEMAAAAAVPSTLNRQCGYPSCSENALRGRGKFGFWFGYPLLSPRRVFFSVGRLLLSQGTGAGTIFISNLTLYHSCCCYVNRCFKKNQVVSAVSTGRRSRPLPASRFPRALMVPALSRPLP